MPGLGRVFSQPSGERGYWQTPVDGPNGSVHGTQTWPVLQVLCISVSVLVTKQELMQAPGPISIGKNPNGVYASHVGSFAVGFVTLAFGAQLHVPGELGHMSCGQ